MDRRERVPAEVASVASGENVDLLDPGQTRLVGRPGVHPGVIGAEHHSLRAEPLDEPPDVPPQVAVGPALVARSRQGTDLDGDVVVLGERLEEGLGPLVGRGRLVGPGHVVDNELHAGLGFDERRYVGQLLGLREDEHARVFRDGGVEGGL